MAVTHVDVTATFPREKLRAYACGVEALRPLRAALEAEGTKILRFLAGQSNPTFKVETPWRGGSLVVRRRPDGKLLPGAHQVDREFTVMRALFDEGFPVPECLALCTGSGAVDVLGTDFYVMRFVEGRVFDDMSLPALPPEERAAAYQSIVSTLAQLHAIDPDRCGLGHLASPEKRARNYLRRNAATWSVELPPLSLPVFMTGHATG